MDRDVSSVYWEVVGELGLGWEIPNFHESSSLAPSPDSPAWMIALV